MNKTSFVIVGKFGSTYGIRGWLRVFSFTEDANNLFSYSPWFISKNNEWVPLTVESFRPHNNELIVKLDKIDDRDQASKLTNFDIYVDSSLFSTLENGDFYWKDLMGCKVLTTKNYDLGEVTEILETGSNDVLVVKANLKDAFSKKERLIPFIEGDCIKQVDLEQKTILVDWDPDF